MNKIMPIETVYKGYRFRSRLEARWAVFFDVLGIEWVYESQGFDLGKEGWYLPDFYLPVHDHPKYGETGRYVEIKGTYPKDTYLRKISCFAMMAKRCVHVMTGDPYAFREFVAHPCGNTFERPQKQNRIWDDFGLDVDDPYKPTWDALFAQVEDFMTENCAYMFVSRDGNFEIAACMQAAIAARSARFEHSRRGVL